MAGILHWFYFKGGRASGAQAVDCPRPVGRARPPVSGDMATTNERAWKAAVDYVINSASGLPLPARPEDAVGDGAPPPRLAGVPLRLGRREADAVGAHEAEHLRLAGHRVSWWPCHVEGTPDDEWVIDMMVDGVRHVRYGGP